MIKILLTFANVTDDQTFPFDLTHILNSDIREEVQHIVTPHKSHKVNTAMKDFQGIKGNENQLNNTVKNENDDDAHDDLNLNDDKDDANHEFNEDYVDEDYVHDVDEDDDDVDEADVREDDIDGTNDDDEQSLQNSEEAVKNKLNQFEQGCAEHTKQKTHAKSPEPLKGKKLEKTQKAENIPKIETRTVSQKTLDDEATYTSNNSISTIFLLISVQKKSTLCLLIF
ncbi:phosphopantothenoylcysteine decarboxylase subunit VHS3-like [Stegodyphus dumicola]|uniref:phosphopantothenoylcysteine decarboxylase subunit VHS3-like n=1 Tax=Stegodyphus dumicola TaxID=202533 RepID=UPI0015B0F91E|nr:phosphopantothenoylcysteine decarboxylase subunit VHS3-like [Stegodyphus dumicola]